MIGGVGVLPDHEIANLGHRGAITPFNQHLVQPASYDARLGDTALVPRSRLKVNDLEYIIDLGSPVPDIYDKWSIIDGYFLRPGEFILGATMERVEIPDDVVCRIEGKSSLGRLGLLVHATAGFIDPGFRGVLTLEMYNVSNVTLLLRPGISICQLSFQTMTSPPEHPYHGRYQGDEGVTGSKLNW